MNFAAHSGKSLARGLVIAAPRSGSGKTMLTFGLLRACRNAGLSVAGAKCGPDYIDPAFHAAASGKPCVNLDSWAMCPALLRALAFSASESADYILCEGVMGLFDGVPAEDGRSGSTADAAAALGWPVVLILDVTGQSQSAAAVVKGCASFGIEIAGVVLNRVASERHSLLVSQAIEAVGFNVLGALPRHGKLKLPERHLGLVQAAETEELEAVLDGIAKFVAQHTDLPAILSCARPGEAPACGNAMSVLPPPAQHIAVAKDDAFSFLYPHILTCWQKAGAEVSFSPLADEPPPNHCGFCWLPGGYPELHAERLAAAARFLGGLRSFAETKPLHGECGGYMVLGQCLTDRHGHAHRMAGLLGVSTSFVNPKLHLGYRQARLADAHSLGAKATLLRGHEFHYATITAAPARDEPFAFVRDAFGGNERPEGSRRGRITGSFFHVIAAEPS